MKVVYQICCGIDVHAKTLVACLILSDGRKQIRSFSTMTDDLLRLRDWLTAAGCTHVAIESTGVYWRPVFNILEDRLKVILVNPEHARALRGRKTDVKDAERLADLLRHDLLQPSFIPPPEIRELRELARYRDSLVREQSSIANRIQKVIESGNIKLGQVASDALGASGRAMLRAMAKGESDPIRLADLALGKLKEKRPQLIRALNGPGNKASGGKRLSGRTRKGNTYLRSALTQAAWAAVKKKGCYLSAQYSRLAGRLGRKKALVAVAHSLLIIIYHVLDRDQSYTELGGDYFDRQHAERQRAYFIRRLQMLGLKVNVEELSEETAAEEDLSKAA